MVSGKYSALSGAIAREQTIANVSNNLANINTTGYKKSAVNFESILQGEKQATEAKGINYSRIKENFTDFSPGALRQTEDPLDIVIHGEGFLKVQGQNGVLYTKRGDLSINGDGLLTTSNGLPVLDDAGGEITIADTETSVIAFSEEGAIYTMGEQGARTEVGQLGIVNFADPSKLKRESDTTFSLAGGDQEIPDEGSRVIQGSLELSNVNMAAEMAKMIDSYRTFETYHKVLKSYSTIGEQQNELGTLG